MPIGIIGGTGLCKLDERAAPETVETAYGPATIVRSALGGREVIFLARHGAGHTIPPHRINYRANIRALADLECRSVLATNAVGSLRLDRGPGAFAVPDQFLDFTRQRALTFFDEPEGRVVHVDFTEPYCPRLRGLLAEAGRELGMALAEGGVYACAEGPRFETAAEIRMYRTLGADLVGMTGVPEVVLAREAGLCYASLCTVTNLAAGVSAEPIRHGEVEALMEARFGDVTRLLAAAVQMIGEGAECGCRTMNAE
jgi:5'-methylthioadenosine phosphorylase